MANLIGVVKQLKKEHERVTKEVRIKAALASLGSITSSASRPHTMSASTGTKTQRNDLGGRPAEDRGRATARCSKVKRAA
jgi:hypothetical protein